MSDVTQPGHAWVCHHCSFTTDDIQEALGHPYEPGTDWPSGNFTHWIYEHPHGDRGQPPTREIHSSDAGGCYLSPIEPDHAARVARDWRDRPSARGVF
jgi:hypothetical protein